MQKLRDQTHIILWGLLILFLLSMTVGGLVGGADILELFSNSSRMQNTAGIVDGEKLEAIQFSKMLDSQLTQYREADQDIDDATMNRISEQVWNQYVHEILVGKEIKKFGLQASDKEIYAYLVDNPPQFLMQNEAFMTDGQFDYQKYLQILQNPQGNEWLGVEEYIRNYLPFEKIRSLITNLAMTTDEEVKEEYLTNNQKYTIEAAIIPMDVLGNEPIPVEEKEIRAYYSEHKKDYFIDEKRELEYVTFDVKATLADSQAVYQTIVGLKNRINGGEAFETIAAEFTEDPSGKQNGGELGWISKGQMVPAFDRAAFSAGRGQMIGPILTNFGYHLIKVEDRRVEAGEPQIKAKHILLKIKPGPETSESQRSTANVFAYDANEFGFAAAADSHNVKIQKTPLFGKEDRMIPGIGVLPSATKFAFSDKPVGTLSELLNMDNGYVLLRLSAVQEKSYTPVEKVTEQIRASILQKKKIEKLAEFAQDFYTKIDKTKSLAETAKLNPAIQFSNLPDVTLSAMLPGIGRSPKVIGMLRALQAGQMSKPIEIGTRMAILKVVAITPFNQTDFDAQKATLRTNLNNRKQMSIYNDWVNELKASVKIVDNRANMYY